MQTPDERRRKKPSYLLPFMYEILEITLMLIVFGIFEGTFNIFEWSVMSYSLSSAWFIFSMYKLNKVLSRQTHH